MNEDSAREGDLVAQFSSHTKLSFSEV